jgi:hypothetical protein
MLLYNRDANFPPAFDGVSRSNELHLQHVLQEYLTFYNEQRPHLGLGQRCPVLLARSPGKGPTSRRDVLGGILHAYYRQAS